MDPTEPRFLDEEEQEKKIKDLKEEDEIINAQFKMFMTMVSFMFMLWFMALAYYIAVARTPSYYVPFVGIPIASVRPLLACEFSVISLQLGLYSIYKDHFSLPFLGASAALFVFQFFLCVYGDSPLERIWWSLPALILAADVYVGYSINVQGIRWSELESRQYKLKGA
ncbi:hypothetical protein IWQ60_002809 [Tieghemiomyces parasiticus]|uniref:Uncharacterized protein n=1 Tax=Tieghemiomyces parasiticus TaxID=78921 RepID=A0A9W8AE22_9FUNG|nr:hypothetical protein IWQ60_002809 [Tieghemiomyces parasiticus]